MSTTRRQLLRLSLPKSLVLALILALLGGVTAPAAGAASAGAGVADFPPVNEATAWLKTERLRGTLFHDPLVQPMFKRFLIRPPTAPGAAAPPVEVIGKTYVVLLPDDGAVRATVEAVKGVEGFPDSLYALFDEAGGELATGVVALGRSVEVKASGQSGPCTLLINSGPGLRNVARVRPGTQFWVVDMRPHAAYDHTPLHYHFLRDLKLGGFNVVMIDFESLPDAFETEAGFASWLAKVKGWTDYARKVDLRVMPSIDLGGSEAEVNAWGASRPGLYIEPKPGMPVAPCPLDKSYWERIFLRRGRGVAKLSLENPCVVGYGLDPEMYTCWNYGHYMKSGTCFCDSCFGGFLRKKGLATAVVQELKTGKERYDWLQQQKLYADYDKYLEDEMAGVANWCRTQLQADNPNLLLNMFVIEIGNWFCRGVARGFGRPGVLAVNFAEETYYGVGYDPKWLDEITTKYRNWGAQLLQGSAVWDLYFPATEPRFIAAHCYNLAIRGQGYWYWPGDNLYRDWGCQNAFYGRPAYWDEFWPALVRANREIVQTLATPGRSSPLDAFSPVAWKTARNEKTGGWDIKPDVACIHQERAYPLILAAPTTLFVHVPEPAGMLNIAARTRGANSTAQLTLTSPDGKSAAERTVTAKEETAIDIPAAMSGVWCITVGKSTAGLDEFAEVGLALGGNSYLATSAGALPLASNKPRGLIGYWPLDEGKGSVAHDASPAPPFDGTILGAQWTDGVAGKALKFNGRNGSVEIAADAPFHRLREFTLCAWVRLDALPVAHNGATLVNKGPESPVQHVWWWIGYPPDYALTLELGNQKHSYGTGFYTGALTWEIGRWYHVAVTFKRDGDNCVVRHYRDGQKVGESTQKEDLHSGEYDLRLGSYGSMHTLNGALHEVKFWNIVLPEAEIRAESARPGTR